MGCSSAVSVPTGPNELWVKSLNFLRGGLWLKILRLQMIIVHTILQDAVYVLTTDDKIYRFKATELADKDLTAESLDKVSKKQH